MAHEILCKLATSPLTMLDLCSGLGGASEPFRRAGWRVVTLDLFERFRVFICPYDRARVHDRAIAIFADSPPREGDPGGGSGVTPSNTPAAQSAEEAR